MDERDYARIAHRYAEDVDKGKIPAGRWVQSACRRQLEDLDRRGWEWKFDRKRAARVCRFVELLPHVKGKWSSKTIILEPWQCFWFSTLFGWVDGGGLRRFRNAYIEVPRKNAKTTACAGLGLYLLGPDDEPGAEIYSAATTRDQARISWEIAHAMAKRTPALCEAYGIAPLAHSIAITGDARFFRPLSRDADTLEGLNVHGAIIDELHAHKTREVHDVLVSATGSRRQPLVFRITTAGADRTGICYEQRAYACNVLSGRHQDDRYFGIVYGIDEEDDWTLEDAWRKANPNYGVSVLAEDVRTLCAQARASAAAQNNFLTKRLNVWVSAGTAYFNVLAWDACADPKLCLADFEGEECFAFLDLASKKDIAAKMLLFKRRGDYYVFGRYYLPEDAVQQGNPNYDFYSGWARENRLTLTPGDVTDYEYIERDLMEDAQRFRMVECGYDPFQATELSTRMRGEGLNMIDVAMNVRNLSEPMKQLDALMMRRRIHHDGDPVLSWMISNVTAKEDVKENVYPRKDRPEAKIDGAVGLIAALGRDMVTEGYSAVNVRLI